MSQFNLNAITAPITSQQGITHAVIQSIYNHGEATQNDQARTGEPERGGHWAKEMLPIVGSRHWTLRREKVTDQTVQMTKRFYQEALTWLIDDSIAKAVTVEVWKAAFDRMDWKITITLMDGTKFEVTP
ncbi:MAG: phage GP46 family protein [Pseudomonadota bacterium]